MLFGKKKRPLKCFADADHNRLLIHPSGYAPVTFVEVDDVLATHYLERKDLFFFAPVKLLRGGVDSDSLVSSSDAGCCGSD